MTARIDRNMLLKLLALEGQGSDAYLADQLEARIDEWLVESTAPAPVEPVLDLDALERVIRAAWPNTLTPRSRPFGEIAAAVDRHVAPILAAARQSTAPTDPSGFTIPTATPADPFEHVTHAEWTPPTPAELAKDPRVAAVVLRDLSDETEADGTRPSIVAFLRSRADEHDPPEPVDPPMTDGQWRDHDGILWQRQFSEGLYGPWRWTTLTGQVGNLVGYRSDEEMRGCRVVPAAEVITRLGLGAQQ